MTFEIDMCSASSLRDTQGEILDIEGADISELEAGRGIFNDNHSGKLPDTLGRVTKAKKIFKLEDCEDERQRYYWSKIKAPYIYVKGYLWDDPAHRSAAAVSAILRHQNAEDSPLKLKASVEGGILERGSKDERILKRTKIKGVALTFTPANNATLVEGLNLTKSAISAQDQALIKSCIPLAKDSVPTFIEIADTLSESKIISNIKKIHSVVKELKKNASDISDIDHHLYSSDHLSIDEVPKTKNSHSKLPLYRQPIHIGRINSSLSKVNLFNGLERLAKANYKALKPMLPQPEHDHVVKWTADNIKHPPLQSWYLRNYKQDNSLHTPENQSKIQHYDGMTKIDDSFRNVDLGRHVDFKAGMNNLAEADKKFQNSKTHLIHEPEGEKMIDFGNGMAWWNLKKPSSEQEGKAMGHCGNAGDPHEDDNVLSLRREHKIGHRSFYEPMATFIHNQNYLGEMKGKANRKPSEETHPYIADLLSHPDVHGATGGQYASEGDFHFDDLNPELQAKVKKANPKFTDIRSNAFSDEQKTSAIDSVPKNVYKMHVAVGNHLRRTDLLNQLNSGSLDPSELTHEDVGHVHDHPLVTSDQVNEAFSGSGHDDEYEGDDHSTAMRLSRSPKLNIDKAVKNNPARAATLLGRRLTDKHVDHLVKQEPDYSAIYLKDRLTDKHVDHIVEHSPYAAADLKDRLTDKHVDRVVHHAPARAAEHLKDRLTDKHVDHVVQAAPLDSAIYLKDRLTDKHVDHVVQDIPHVATTYLKDRLTDKHVDHILKNDPRAAAEHLKDRLTDKHVDHVVQAAPHAAAEHLKDRLTDKHVDHLVQVSPYVTAEHLKDRLTDKHVDHVVQDIPYAATYLKDRLTDKHVDRLVQHFPRAAAEYLKDHPLLNASHVDHLVEKAPSESAIYLKDRLTDKHVDHIVEHSPYSAAYFEDRVTDAQKKKLQEHGLLKSLVKTLSAGVGVGSPTDRTGGQVLQTESLEEGSHRIECPSCGKSQHYMKHQVKCRDCGKSFPFDTLAKFFLRR